MADHPDMEATGRAAGEPSDGFVRATVPNLLSIIVPVHNEGECVRRLLEEIEAALEPMDCAYEVIIIDDGLDDGTGDVLTGLSRKNRQIKLIQFRRNFGNAAALDAGFQLASGDVIVTMAADLQDDPAEIPKFLAKLQRGYDLVSGWKHVRHDPLDKTLPSKVFNFVVSRMSGVRLHDFNCGFKAYRAEAVRDLSLYGELHRFIPVLLHWDGFRVGEIAVNHRAPELGSPKYGAGRLFKGALDFLGVMLNTRFAARPLHVFGGAGMVFGGIGTAALLYLSVLWSIGAGPIGARPLLFFGMLMVMTGFQLATIGLLGEFIQRQSARPKRLYTIRAMKNFPSEMDVTDRWVDQLNLASQRLNEVYKKWQTPPSAPIRPSDISPDSSANTRFTD